MIFRGRKGPALLLCGALLFSPLSAAADGTAPTYIEVSDTAGLDAIRQDMDGHYRLTADITFDAADFAEGGAFFNNGNGWDPIGSTYADAFTGELDGNGHTIAGLTITKAADSGSVVAGLFGYASGTIHDLNMADTAIAVTGGDYVYAGSVTAVGLGSITDVAVSDSRIVLRDIGISGKVGGIAGRMFSGAIVRSAAAGEMDVTGVSPAVGGIAGQSQAAMEQVFSEMDMTVSSRGDCYVGGIAGINEKSIHAALAVGGIQVTSVADGNVGGIAGWNQNTVTDSLAVGVQTRAVSNYDNFGGVIGSNDGTVRDSYYAAASCANSPAVTGVTPLTDGQLAARDSFAGWDFDTDWTVGHPEDSAYPVPQSVARQSLKRSLEALMIPIEDPARYTASSLEAVRTARQDARALTETSSPDAYRQAIDALEQAHNNLTEKQLLCTVQGAGTVEVTGTNRYGQTVTLTASPADGQVFSGFVMHQTFYPQSTVEATVSGAENATAYFRGADACTVLFRGKYGRVMDVQTVTTATELVAPVPPPLQGYTFVGWSTDLRELDLSGGCVSVDAVYTVDAAATGYSLTLIDAVADRPVEEPLPFDTCVSLTPAEKEGQTFSHWLINGTVASTDPSYSLFVAGNDRVQAVYDADTAPEAAASVQHTSVTTTADGRYTLNAIGQVYLPDGAAVVEYGMLFAADGRCADDPAVLTLNSPDHFTLPVTASSARPNRRYLTYLSGVPSGATRYLRSYLVLRTADGDRQIVYSPVTAITMPN